MKIIGCLHDDGEGHIVNSIAAHAARGIQALDEGKVVSSMTIERADVRPNKMEPISVPRPPPRMQNEPFLMWIAWKDEDKTSE
jgi:hypothetical protein